MSIISKATPEEDKKIAEISLWLQKHNLFIKIPKRGPIEIYRK